VGAPFATSGQEFWQAPQLSGVLIAVSQPFDGSASQSAKPVMQSSLQTLSAHAGEAFLPLGQAFPQVPQLFGSVVTSVQPPQFVCPVGHAVTHVPPAQTCGGHFVKHPPHVWSELSDASQPLVGSLSQSPRSLSQFPIAHFPSTQTGVANGRLHGVQSADAHPKVGLFSFLQVPLQDFSSAAQLAPPPPAAPPEPVPPTEASDLPSDENSSPPHEPKSNDPAANSVLAATHPIPRRTLQLLQFFAVNTIARGHGI
jgi:hypothetical protein